MSAGDRVRLIPAFRRPRHAAGRSARAGLAVACAATTVAVSYALQRLGAWALGEPPMGVILAQAHTPYLWRLALAALHGGVVGLAIGLALDEERAAGVLRWAPLLIPAVVLPLALAMVAAP